MRCCCWVLLFLLLFALPLPARAAAPLPAVRYLAAKDRLSIRAEDASLRTVLAQLARQTGIRISMSPAAETRLNLTFTDLPLETGLKRLERSAGVNHLEVYGPGAKNAPGLLTLKILPAGATGGGDLAPVAPAAGAAAGHPAAPATAHPLSIHEVARRHREQRLATLPPAKRQELEAQLDRQRQQRNAVTDRHRQLEATRDRRRAERAARLDALANGKPLPHGTPRPAAAHP